MTPVPSNIEGTQRWKSLPKSSSTMNLLELGSSAKSESTALDKNKLASVSKSGQQKATPVQIQQAVDTAFDQIYTVTPQPPEIWTPEDMPHFGGHLSISSPKVQRICQKRLAKLKAQVEALNVPGEMKTMMQQHVKSVE